MTPRTSLRMIYKKQEKGKTKEQAGNITLI